jgi:hypothetical protein
MDQRLVAFFVAPGVVWMLEQVEVAGDQRQALVVAAGLMLARSVTASSFRSSLLPSRSLPECAIRASALVAIVHARTAGRFGDYHETAAAGLTNDNTTGLDPAVREFAQ